MKQLTVKEALDQGYEYYVYNDEGFQSLKHISDMDMDFSRPDILFNQQRILQSSWIKC